jgi:hypothetical protein
VGIEFLQYYEAVKQRKSEGQMRLILILKHGKTRYGEVADVTFIEAFAAKSAHPQVLKRT